jgi:hypothetical protein
MAVATFYILYAGLYRIFDMWLYISIGLLVFETLVLLINRWTCPLTPIAMKYTTDRGANFDIYLPNVLAKHNKMIFGTLFVIGLLLIVYNYFN